MQLFIKRLTANELGATGANTRGEIYIPARCLSFFPELSGGKVRKVVIPMEWTDNGSARQVRLSLTLYTSKNEAHLHRVPDDFLQDASAGDILTLKDNNGVFMAVLYRSGQGRHSDINRTLGTNAALVTEDKRLDLSSRTKGPPTAQVVTSHPLADGIAPAWASGWGEDARGPFVELTVKEVTQRLRWIPPGRFQMGSPDDDEFAADNEKPQHWVEMSCGFWMFDTPTTQELWEVVMGEDENRSEFKSPYRPVEKVSWDDCQQFFDKVSELAPGVKLGLPTEAEWEYACRAGTTDATYAGPIEILGERNAPVLDAVAWYGGNCGVEWKLPDAGYDTSSWPEKQYEMAKGGTRVVATRDPNPWGLYDTLGNVYEWCRDASYRDYADESVIDPFHDGESSASRVIRGGSWGNAARDVRAAYRYAYSPGYRINFIGFRCRVL